MNKKTLTAAMALAALAVFVSSNTASAAQLTSPTGTLAAVGTKLKGINLGNNRLMSDDGTTVLTECSSTSMTAEVIKNNGTEVEANVTTVAAAGTGALFNGSSECTGSFGSFTATFNVGNGVPWCIKSVNGTDEFTIRGNLCTQPARSITVVIDSTTAASCKYSRTEAFKGTFTTDTSGSDASLSMAPGANTTVTKEEGGVFCPATGTLSISYTLEKDEAGSTPVYIS